MQPYFVLQGNICAILAAKDHINVFLYDGGIVPDPEGVITGGHANRTARTVAIREGEKINSRALQRIFEQIIANNRAGGWRKLKTSIVAPPLCGKEENQALKQLPYPSRFRGCPPLPRSGSRRRHERSHR